MKPDVAKQHPGSGEPVTAALPKPRSGEVPLSDEPAGVEETEDLFEEVPTVANRALPATGDENAGAPAGGREAPGTYRLVHPTVSDFVDQPVATKIDPPAVKGVPIGSARKPR